MSNTIRWLVLIFIQKIFHRLAKTKRIFWDGGVFGRFDPGNDEKVFGLPVLRPVEVEQIAALLDDGELTDSMDEAMVAFVLGSG